MDAQSLQTLLNWLQLVLGVGTLGSVIFYLGRHSKVVDEVVKDVECITEENKDRDKQIAHLRLLVGLLARNVNTEVEEGFFEHHNGRKRGHNG